VRKTNNLTNFNVLKYVSLNLLRPSGPVQACNGITLPFFTVLNCDALTKLLFDDGYRGLSFHCPTLKIPKDKITNQNLLSLQYNSSLKAVFNHFLIIQKMYCFLQNNSFR